MKSSMFVAFAIAAGLIAGTAAADTLTVGVYPTNPPWEFKNEQSEFEGFEVDMVTEIAERLGLELDLTDMGFQAIFAATSSGRIDLAISTITITDERLENQAFTQGYYDADMALVSTEDGAQSLDDMRDQPVGVLASSVAEGWVNDNMDTYGFSDLRTYNDQQGLLLDVNAGRIAGAIGDVTGFIFATKDMPSMSIAEVIPTGDRYGMMLPQGSELLEPINDAISEMKRDGTMAEIYERWLGETPDEDSSTVTVLDIPTLE
ncbi:MAG: polar amino acid transport system substrate-binding protein [Rhodobacteraceae bacterium HLUCCA12]|nr:MAG: polar amino acid transport system substrate-binding protein [Rhodobacteraceae bacterium HLUCCA12]